MLLGNAKLSKFVTHWKITSWCKQLLESAHPLLWKWSKEVSPSHNICFLCQNSTEALLLRRLQNCVWLIPNKLNGFVNAGWSVGHLHNCDWGKLTRQTVKSGKRTNLSCQYNGLKNSLQQQVLAGHNIIFSTTQYFQNRVLQFAVPAQLESTQTQTAQQSLKVHLGSLGIQHTRACTLENEMQLQLCTKDEATQQAKPTCTANLGHTRSGLSATDETATRFARFGKSCT